MTKRLASIISGLGEMFPEARAELDFKNAYELLVATILSAQCTDARVNLITKDLFELAVDAKALNDLALETLESCIHSCGMHRTKAAHLKRMAKTLVEEYGGEVPSDRQALTSLSGVGNKTASVVLANAFGIPAFPVDTHVTRVAFRLGLTDEKDPDRIAKDLMKLFPRKSWIAMHHRMIFLGRYTCKARNPQCADCRLSELCPKRGVR